MTLEAENRLDLILVAVKSALRIQADISNGAWNGESGSGNPG